MVETDINKRWEEGTEHHPRSRMIVKALAELDYYAGGDHLRIKIGGDGDNGEHMMYLLDILFEAREQGLTLDDLLAKLKPEHDAKMKAKFPGMF